MHKSCIKKPSCLDMSQITGSFRVSKKAGVVASLVRYMVFRHSGMIHLSPALFAVHVTLG